MKPFAIVLSGIRRELGGEMVRGDLTNVQCKAIRNCHNESPLYNKYMLIKMKKSKMVFIQTAIADVLFEFIIYF
jgi:hypothetical protein